MKELLRELAAMSSKMAAEILLSKEKDDFRGARIIPDYSLAHIPAAQDRFVVTAMNEAHELREDIEAMLKKL